MGFFSAAKKKDEIALVFDVGSSSVGAALFLMQSSGAPKILFSLREQIPLQEELDFDAYLASTMRAFETVAQKVSVAGKGAPTKIFCTLAGLWTASQTKTVKYKNDMPFIFNKKLADSLMDKEITVFEKEHVERLKHSDNKVRPIEFKNMKTMLNGYPTANPLNQKAKDLEMHIFISLANEQILGHIEESVFRHFHSKEVKFASFLMSSFAVARDMFVHQDNFLLVDIGGEITDISMIKKDVLQESRSFPIGRNFIIRGVARELKCSLAEAQSFISLYKDGHAAESTERILEPVLTRLKAEWLASFQEALANLSNDISIPATIFITIDGEFVEFFSSTIKNEQFNQYTLTESKFRVIFLGTEALHGIAEFDPAALRDAFLIIESIYIARFLR
ncbi:MAG: hypothetical protein WDN09_03840 [bacterium]